MTQGGHKTQGRGKKLTSSSKKLRRAIPPSGLVKVGGGRVCTIMESHGIWKYIFQAWKVMENTILCGKSWKSYAILQLKFALKFTTSRHDIHR